MTARLRTAAIVVGAVVLIAVGFFLLRGPKPHIAIKAETLWAVGPIDITNTLFTSWIVVAIILIGAFLSTRTMALVPSRWQSFVESAIEALLTLCTNTVGEKNGRRFFPVIATIFLFIVISNWLALVPIFNSIGKVEPIGVEEAHFQEESIVFEGSGPSFIMPGATEVEFEHIDESLCEGFEGAEHEHCLEELRAESIAHGLEEEGVEEGATVGIIAPYFRGMNTDLMAPLSLAIVSAIFVEFWGITTLGFFAYGSKFVNIGRLMKGDPMGIIDVFVGILEFIAEIARLISFSFRLFGNLLAGEILLLVMTFLVPLLLAVPFYGLELFVGAIQAFVFAMLTLVFGALAVTAHGDDHGEEHHDAAEGDAALVHQAE